MSDVVLDRQLLGKPRESYWILYIKKRIQENKNFLGFISGQTGSGKSWTSLSICEQLDPEFSIERVVFTGEDLMALLNSDKLHKGSAVVFEEAGVGMGNRQWQSRTNQVLGFLMQTFRNKNLVLILNSPYMDFIDKSIRMLFHAELSTKGINYDNNTVRLKAFTLQYNSSKSKMYYKKLRVITAQGKLPVKFWNVKKPNPELIRQYEQKKTEFTENLNKKIQEDIRLDNNKRAGIKDKELTPRQEQVANLLKEGKLFPEIAKILGITPKIVNNHVVLIRNKGYKVRPFKDKQRILYYSLEKPT